MKVDIVSLQQNYPLDGSEPQTYLILQLADGRFIRAEVDDQAATWVLEANDQSQEVEPQPVDHYGELQPEEPAVHVPVVGLQDNTDNLFATEDNVQEDLFEWERLPANILSPTMKNIFREINVPAKISPKTMEEIIDRVVAGMNEGAKEEEEAKEESAPTPVQPAVSVHQNAGVVRTIPPRRTVATDEAGYPVVRQTNQSYVPDPGEVQDHDEDGVGQL